MRFIDRLEQRFGRFGIPNLILIVTIGRSLAWFLSMRTPEFARYLVLDPVRVREGGEYWRLVSFVFTPPAGGPFLSIIDLYFTFFVGRIIEEYWGAFRFTLYYLFGILATAVVAFLFLSVPIAPYYLNLSLFLAFATLFPEMPVLLFFILPVKVKYLGWFSAFLLTLSFWTTDLAGKLAIVAALSNYLLFFWADIRDWMRGRFRRDAIPTAPPEPPSIPPPLPPPMVVKPVHRCETCGKTERDDRELVFRFCACAECGEGREYCAEHLAAHRKAVDSKARRKGK